MVGLRKEKWSFSLLLFSLSISPSLSLSLSLSLSNKKKRLTLVQPPAQQRRVRLRPRGRDHELERVGDVDRPRRRADRPEQAACDAGRGGGLVAIAAVGAIAGDLGAGDVVGDVDDDELFSL